MKVNYAQLELVIESCIKARRPLLIVGGPGVGKTSVVDLVTKRMTADLIKSFPAVEDPTEPGGYPWIAKDHSHATKVLFGQAYKAVNATKLTVWFLDDLGQATAATQAAYMQWLLAREMNGHKLPENVVMIAATNRRIDRAGVTGILEPVKSRFVTIVELVPDLEEWLGWYFQQPWCVPEVGAYLRFSPESLNQFVPSADLTNCPVPRTWENATHVLNMNLPTLVEARGVEGAIGEGEATKLLGFIRMAKDMPNIDALLKDPDGQPLPTNTSVMHATVCALAVKATVKNMDKVCRYAQRLYDAAKGEFAAYLINDATRRDPDLQQTVPFVELMSGELGTMITGAR